ncbi:hypothetical protein PF003_g8 [Phytophthora fragariae]|nr:hypothetical protein PF003_g8 [Phytophthora fragariae]
MRLHPTFYVGRLKPYVPATIPSSEAESPRPARNRSRPAADADAKSARALAPGTRASPSVVPRTRQTPSDGASPSSRATPAPIESQQPLPPQRARAQTQQGSEPPSRRPSPGQSPAPSAGITEALGAPRRDPLGAKWCCSSFGTSAMGPRRLWMHRGRGDTPWSAGLITILAPTARRTLDPSSGRTLAVPLALRIRTAAPEKHYRMRWFGHSPAEETWEPRSRLLEDVPDLVSDYEASLALASARDCDASAQDPASRTTARASPLSRVTTTPATTSCNFEIPASPVVAPEPATIIFAQRPVHHLVLPLLACRPRTILAPGATFDQVHVAQAPLALCHLAHARWYADGLACRRHGDLQNEHAAPPLRVLVVQLAASITFPLATALIEGECNFERGGVM